MANVGTCTDEATTTAIVIPPLTVDGYLMGATTQEGTHIEPTRGQIWPR